jgi:hypothetical protein
MTGRRASSEQARAGVQKADWRNPEQLAETRSLAAIALQAGQLLWRNRTHSSLNNHCANANYTETNNGLEKLRPTACEHLATKGARDHAHVCNFTDRSLHFNGGRRNRNSNALRSTHKSHDLRHDQGQRRDLLQGLRPEDRSADRLLPPRAADFRGRATASTSPKPRP